MCSSANVRSNGFRNSFCHQNGAEVCFCTFLCSLYSKVFARLTKISKNYPILCRWRDELQDGEKQKKNAANTCSRDAKAV